MHHQDDLTIDELYRHIKYRATERMKAAYGKHFELAYFLELLPEFKSSLISNEARFDLNDFYIAAPCVCLEFQCGFKIMPGSILQHKHNHSLYIVRNVDFEKISVSRHLKKGGFAKLAVTASPYHFVLSPVQQQEQKQPTADTEAQLSLF